MAATGTEQVQSVQLTLKVHVGDISGGTTYTYAEALVYQGDREALVEKARAGEIEMSELGFELDQAFLGATTRLGLPNEAAQAEGYRAVACARYEVGATGGTLTTHEVTLIDGTIRRSDIEHIPDLERWAVTVRDEANRILMERLADVPDGSDDNLTVGDTVSAPTYIVSARGDEGVELQDVTWYDLKTLFTSTMSGLGVTLSYQSVTRVWFSLDAQNDPLVVGGADNTRTDLPVYVAEPLRRETSGKESLPVMSARDLLELLQVMLGWRLQARFDAFPATTITLHVLTDRWALDPSGATELDTLVGADEDGAPIPYGVGYDEPDLPDFALQYETRVGEAAIYYSDDELDRDAATGGMSQPASELAVYGAPQGHFRLDGEGQGQNDDLQRIGLLIPQTVAREEVQVTDGSYSEDVTIGIPVIKEGAGAYVAAFEQDGDTVERFVERRTPVGAKFGGLDAAAEYWAAILMGSYEISRSAAYRVEGVFDLGGLAPQDAIPATGDPTATVQFGGQYWMVAAIEHRLRTAMADLTLRHHIGVTGLEASQPGVPAPVAVEACIYADQAAAGQGVEAYNIDIRWSEPEVSSGQAPPDTYEIEILTLDADWTALYTASSCTGDCSYTDAGGYAPDDLPVAYRIRAVSTGGTPSAWVYATPIDCEAGS
ncbi:MAG: hypothetical protein GVY18_05225 [Bacteroidetes bacterium]|jgi:hypothetical protein|nr:hypothetical protein [Bacteroidota bacterium]